MPNQLQHYPAHNTLSTIDIGANLTNSSFSPDLHDVLARAKQSGLQHIIVTGTSLDETEAAIALVDEYPQFLSCTAGIHPHDAKSFETTSKQQLKDLASQPSVKAIGETGLDFNRNYSTPKQQINAFEQQIELAIELGLPLFLHERDAHQKQWQMLSYYRDEFCDAVIHCFTGSKQECFKYLDLDLHIGITGWICDERRGHHLHEFVGDIPLNKLMLETDAPYLMPRVKPKPALNSRRRNEPCTISYVLETLGIHCGISPTALAHATTENAIRFFKL